MQELKFKVGTRVRHKKMIGAGEVLGQVNGITTKVRWYNKEQGFLKLYV